MDNIEATIDRAATLLGFMSPKDAAKVLADAGMDATEAFLAIQAAAILVQPAAACADEGGQSLGGEMAHDAEMLAAHNAANESDADYLDRHVWDDGDYLDRSYTGRV